ncbi:Zinc finger CCCH domain-containing protein 2 [Apostasia shenzhenica]|uniref:Zinc finger CCCH domain-containing protein 2 n=1 Tax=Apostasia shenzhenica TaxID=1088818 RepID=A0A2I0ANX9_9ASPA|nr:Zinc finger CCCH domain-containing protein 2 [Apostasia shenzhenica]
MGENARRRVLIPPWPILEESIGVTPTYSFALSSTEPSRLPGIFPASESDSDELDLADPPDAAYSSDEFRMYEFKVRRCSRGRSHDWTECPFAHPGEKARRRDPRRFNYSGSSCPDFRKGNCKKGDSCEYAHGVFESWLHPARYRTQPCKDGTACRRPVCFFAHTAEQLRVFSGNEQHQQQRSPRSAAGSPKVADSYDGSPLRRRASLEAYLSTKGLTSSSPTSTLAPAWDSPPVSPAARMMASMKVLHLRPTASPPPATSWGGGFGGCEFGCSRAALPAGITCLSATPLATAGVDGAERSRVTGGCKIYDSDFYSSLRESPEEMDAGVGFPAPDVGWVSELVK